MNGQRDVESNSRARDLNVSRSFSLAHHASRITHHVARASRVALFAAAALAFTGCGHLEPWVKPYERAALADPIMMGSRDPVADEYMHHVHEVREGARGASGSAGGGCGCN